MDRIAAAIERLEAAVERRHDVGVGTSRSVTSSAGGMRCTTEEGGWIVDSDLTATLGGTATAPTPGVLVRAALGACMAMSYRLRAAKHGVELTSVTVTIEADSELAGMLWCDSPAPPGYTEVRYHVDVESPAAVTDVERVIDEGDRLSPLLDVFARENTMRRTMSIRSSRA